jgi:glucosylceramidase
MTTAVQNPDGSIAVVIFNPEPASKNLRLRLANQTLDFSISAKAVQTVVIPRR